MEQAYKRIPIKRYKNGGHETADDGVIIEQAVSLTVNGNVWLTFMCSPIHLEELAVGFLFNEKIIASMEEVEDVRVCEHRDNIDVWLNRSVEEPSDWRRTSGCTGGYTTAVLEEVKPVPSDNLRLSSNQVLGLITSLLQSQDIYRQSGGVHSSALATPSNILFQMEDVGRHNTLDKIAGRLLIENHRIDHPILLSTGRISSEMLQKAARIKVAVLISRTSPTSTSVELAEQLGITLIGYARGQRFNLYSHPERITFSERTS
jgi:FdhD protein